MGWGAHEGYLWLPILPILPVLPVWPFSRRIIAQAALEALRVIEVVEGSFGSTETQGTFAAAGRVRRDEANFSAKYRATQRFFARARELGVNEHSFEHTHQDWSLTSRERVYRDE